MKKYFEYFRIKKNWNIEYWRAPLADDAKENVDQTIFELNFH